MKRRAFSTADILMPKGVDMTAWSVIACDQFSSDRGYWERVGAAVNDAPSTLHMVVPEAFLGGLTIDEAARARNAVMDRYLAEGLFELLPDSLVYVERAVTGGVTRRGLVGRLDLDAYEYSKGTRAPVRASENTLVERLPPRVAVREGAALELPHVMVLIDDAAGTVIEPLTAKKPLLPKLYDFELMEGGGHISGYRVTGAEAEKTLSAMDALFERPFAMVIGDGNHSLAAAKACWDKIKAGLAECERETHPARYALVEVNNVYDEGVLFEPIHRVVFGAAPDKLLAFVKTALGEGDGGEIRYAAGDKTGVLTVPSASLGGLIAAVQRALDGYVSQNGGTIDYIHDDASAIAFAGQKDTAAFLMPPMDKAELFKTVAADGVFPKKSFSIGHARDKRYYLECRRISK